MKLREQNGWLTRMGYNVVIQRLGKHGRVDTLVEVFDDATKMDQIDGRLFNTLIHALVENNQLEIA